MKRIILIVSVCILVAAAAVTGILLWNKNGSGSDFSGTLSDGEYRIYYLNEKGTGLEAVTYSVESKSDEKIITECFNAMRKSSEDKLKTVVPDNLVLISYRVENDILYMEFSDTYYYMSNVDEILFRMAVVKTMAQLDSVSNIIFYVNGQPLTNSNGTPIGMMSASSFITDSKDSMDVHWFKMDLYFSDAKGEKLVKETTDIAYSAESEIERVIMEHLINGPEDVNNKKTLPTTLKVISASTKDGVCYVNLDSTFLSSLADVSAQVTFYSIVNSLCELPSVKRVQILVNGSADHTFRETFHLSETYERNLDLISQGE